MFAKKFSSIFSREVLTDQQVSLASANTQTSGLILPNVTVNSVCIIAAASNLKASTSLGPDGIPSLFLKKCIDSLVVPLEMIFNLSLSSKAFPSCWKTAYMFPVHKKGDRKNIDNYRGISSLCALSKLFELTVMDSVFSHCKQFLSPDQHGFIPFRSTATNLLCLTSYATDSMLEHAQTDVLYLDLSAAFDKINHQIAVAKLEKLGIHGSLLGWFQSYLNDRHSQVVIGDSTSVSFPITSGIPQGSHLGPLIFLLYLNDVNAVLDGPRLSFADDFKLYFKVRSDADARHLQQQLDAFEDWCQKNRMIVNPEKCSVISLSRLKNPKVYNYFFAGAAIERVDHIKDLGVILDSQMTFRQHVSYIVDKASKTLGFIFRITKTFTDVYCLKALYCALVRSALEYCSCVWSPNYQNGAERIESVQRRFLRFALRHLPWRDPLHLPSYESRCRLINLDVLGTRRDVAKALLVSDIVQGHVDCPNILQQIDFYVQPRALRNNAMLRPPTRRTNYGMNSAITGLQRAFNRVSAEFDFNVSRDVLRERFFNVFS